MTDPASAPARPSSVGSRPAPSALVPIALAPLLIVALMLFAGSGAMFFVRGWNLEGFSAVQAWSIRLPDSLWAAITVCGSGLGAFAILSIALRSRPRWVAAGLATAPIAGLYSNLVKRIVALPRPAAVLAPDHIHVIGETLRNNSFPSGHAVTAFAFAAIVVLASRRPLVVALWMVPLAALIALSRIAVGAHWPADLAAGAAGGWLSGACGVAIATRWRQWNTVRGIRAMALIMMVVGSALLLADLGYPLAWPLQFTLGIVAIVSGACAFAWPRMDPHCVELPRSVSAPR